MRIELLYFDGCPNYETLLPHLRELVGPALASAIELHRIESEEDAWRARFLGSPTVRVDGKDVDSGAESRGDYGLKCRLYRTPEGLAGTPPDEWITALIEPKPSGESSRPARSPRCNP